MLSTLLCIGVFSGFGQNKHDPFPTDCEPFVVSPESASLEAKEVQGKCGFGSVFFGKKDLDELKSVKKCVGLRFYIAMERPDQRFADVIAVAINEDGKEIGDFLERKYHLAKALDAHFPHEFQKLNKSKAKGFVMNVKIGDSKLDQYAGYIGVDRLNSLLSQVGSQGIRIYPAEYVKDDKTYRTMSFGSIKLDGKDVRDMGSDYLEGRLPCPVDCGGEGDERHYLWTR